MNSLTAFSSLNHSVTYWIWNGGSCNATASMGSLSRLWFRDPRVSWDLSHAAQCPGISLPLGSLWSGDAKGWMCFGEGITCRHEVLGGVEARYPHRFPASQTKSERGNGMWTSCGRSEGDVLREEGVGVSFPLHHPCRCITHAATKTHHSWQDNLGIIYMKNIFYFSNFLNCNDNELYSQVRSFFRSNAWIVLFTLLCLDNSFCFHRAMLVGCFGTCPALLQPLPAQCLQAGEGWRSELLQWFCTHGAQPPPAHQCYVRPGVLPVRWGCYSLLHTECHMAQALASSSQSPPRRCI